MAMEWNLTSFRTMTSGDYVITAPSEFDRAGRYYAWHKYSILHSDSTLDACKQACEQHAKENAK